MRRFAREHPDQCIEPTVQTTRENRVPPALTVTDRISNDEISLINMRAITPTTEAILPPPLATAMTHERPESHAKILNQMRKWGCQFDGRDPVAFLERVDELCAGYGYTGEQLLRGIPELLRGDALLWARNNREFWESWDDFCADFRTQYFPPQYSEQLQREIFERRQRENEIITQYATVMMTLMRRAGGFSRGQQLDRIHANMRPTYRKYVRRGDVRSLTELIARVTELEGIEREERDAKTEKKNLANRPTVSAVYDRDECCWKCGQRGHTRHTCQRPPKKFCSQCGKHGAQWSEIEKSWPKCNF